MISILVPVLGRPARAQPLVDSIRSSSAAEHEIVFLCSPADGEQYHACHMTGEHTMLCAWKAGRGDYAKKINRGFRETSNEFILMAADDLRFHPGWDTALLRVAEATGAAVTGSDDLGNPQVSRKQAFSTHPLIRRSYIEKEGGTGEGKPGVVLHEGYDHNFVDRELWDVAASRGKTAFAFAAKIEHLHPHWRKGAMDPVYEKGLKHFHDDQRLYWSRHELWGGTLGPRESAELGRWSRRKAKA